MPLAPVPGNSDTGGVPTRQLTPHHATATAVAPATIDIAPLAALVAQPADPIGTVLLVPGYTGSKEDFAPILDPLAAAGWHTVAVDLPGQFESPGPTDPNTYTVPWLGNVVNDIATSLPHPVHLVGHSFGGLVARAAVLADPSAYTSLTLMASGPASLPTGPRTRMMDATEPLMEQGLEVVYMTMQRAIASNPAIVTPPEPVAAFFQRRFLANTPAGLLGMGWSLRNEPDLVAELAGVDIPILVLNGEFDDAWSPAIQADMAAQLAADHVVLPRVAHSPALDDPKGTVDTLLKHFTQ